MEFAVMAHLNEAAWAFLESSLLPPESSISRGSLRWSCIVLQQVGCSALGLPVVAVTSVLALAEKIVNVPLKLCSRRQSQNPNNDFTVVTQNSKEWNKITTIKDKLLHTPPGANNPEFLYGTASCTYQDSGYNHCPQSQWASWEKKILPLANQSGNSANLFELYQTDPQQVIERLLQLGVNSYRTSIEWSQIEPEPGIFNNDALNVYVAFFKLLVQHGIEPMVTFHHFSEPQWFHNKGSFEQEGNIADFVRFTKYAYINLTQEFEGRPLVKHFCTINEPGIEAFSRFVRGAYSPGVTFNFHRAALFLKGALKAHCAVYKALKALPPIDTKIGFTHQYLHFIPNNVLVAPVTRYLTALINETLLNLFKTHTFAVKIPFLCHVLEPFKPEEVETDFIGVQYYTRPIIGMTGSISSHSDEAMTAMPFREDPAGLYEAIVKTHEACGKPIIVTENGISTHDPQQRDRYMTRALYALQQAEQKLGRDAVIGYYQWCLVNNFEWDLGMVPQAFGAFDLERHPDNISTIPDHPKEGIDVFIKTIEAWRQIHQGPSVAEPVTA